MGTTFSDAPSTPTPKTKPFPGPIKYLTRITSFHVHCVQSDEEFVNRGRWPLKQTNVLIIQPPDDLDTIQQKCKKMARHRFVQDRLFQSIQDVYCYDMFSLYVDELAALCKPDEKTEAYVREVMNTRVFMWNETKRPIKTASDWFDVFVELYHLVQPVEVPPIPETEKKS